MRVVWSDKALRSLVEIHERISSESIESIAHQVIDKILRRGDQLATFPLSGRIVERLSGPEIRELIESPYRIVYRVESDRVQVIEVFHSAQLPPWERRIS